MKFARLLPALLAALLLPAALRAADTSTAATAINTLGIELLAKTGKAGANALISPYSIQSTLAMTYAGADGGTRSEMARVLHFPRDGAELNASFFELNKELNAITQESATFAEIGKMLREGREPVSLMIANRLFGQSGFEFRKSFLDTLQSDYGAPFEALDFSKKPGDAVRLINQWVETQTKQRIQDLIPGNALNKETRLVLVNAIYFKAAWNFVFQTNGTEPRPFRIAGTEQASVPTMLNTSHMAFAKRDGCTAVAIPYINDELQFLILLPDQPDGLAAFEANLDAKLLSACAHLEQPKVTLYLPKFKMEPPTLALGDELKSLGMKSAFDIPKGSANFDIMAPQTPDSYLFISQIFHKTFLTIDEYGTEAAAATSNMMATLGIEKPEAKPVEIHVDHPFLFAIQHRASGACLFLGRVTDPR
jgi:serpin B